MSRSQTERWDRLLKGSVAEQHNRAWNIPPVTARVADLDDAEQFPEIHLARLHAAKLRETARG